MPKVIRDVSPFRLFDVLRDIEARHFVVPDFQREFVWDANDIRELIYSVLNDYHIGSLLLWNANPQRVTKELMCENLYGFRDRAPNADAKWIVLDGQQRLSALHYAFFGSQKPVRIPDSSGGSKLVAVKFVIEVDKFMDPSANEQQRKLAIKFEPYPDGRATQAQQGDDAALEFPLEGISARLKTARFDRLWDLLAKLDKEREAAETQRDRLNKKLSPRPWEAAQRRADECRENHRRVTEFMNLVDQAVSQFELIKVEVLEEARNEDVVDLFVQINRQGRRLTPFGRLNAVAALCGVPMTRYARDFERHGNFGLQREHLETTLLRMMMIRAHPQSRYGSRLDADFLLPGRPFGRSGEPLVRDADHLDALWEQAVNDLTSGVTELRSGGGYGIVNARSLTSTPGDHAPGFPSVSMIPVFCALHADAKGDSVKEQKVRQWYWASVLADRYDSETPPGRKDLNEVRNWFASDQKVPDAIQRVREHFGLADLDGVRDEEGAGRALRIKHHLLLNLMCSFRPRDWQSNVAVRLDSTEVKFIVPRDWCGDNAVRRRLTFSPFNRVLLERDTAERLGDRLPSGYLPELLNSWPEATEQGILASHFISDDAREILMRDPLSPDDLEAFLHDRAVTFLRHVGRDLFQTDLGVLPDMRELDLRITKLEHTLRDIIAKQYNSQGRDIPVWVRREVNEHRQRRGLQRASDLRGHLDFASLSHLQSSVVDAWGAFSDLFADGGEENAAMEFDSSMYELIGLRNDIRHATPVDRARQLKGEGAVIWLEDRCRRFQPPV